MKIISHRCNLDGPNAMRENKIAAMRECLSLGFDVELDVWADAQTGKIKISLGHDRPAEFLGWDELVAQRDRLWLHCKNLNALHALGNHPADFNFFWHQKDDWTLTSHNIIWVYPGMAYTSRSVIVLPERKMAEEKLGELMQADCYGVCTDYPVRL